MAGEDDPPWEDEFDAETKADTDKTVIAEAVPTEVSSRDTGKYKTLPGFSVAADVQSELAFGRGCAHCTKRVLMALKLRLIQGGANPAGADVWVEKFKQWMHDPNNAELVRVALED